MEVVNKLKEYFSKEHSLNLNKESEEFVHIFREIGNTVSAAELKRNKNISEEYLDDKVFKEIVKYLVKNKEDMVSKKVFKLKEIQSAQTPQPVLKKKWIHINNDKEVDINLNVHSFKITDFTHRVTSNSYNITDDNNTLVFKEKAQSNKDLYTEEKKIVLENGKYDTESLLNELRFKFSQQNLHHTYYFYTDDITKKLAITTIKLNDPRISVLRSLKPEDGSYFKILWDKSNISSTLGFNADSSLNDSYTFIGNYPINLQKEQKPLFLTLKLDDFYTRYINIKETVFDETFTPYEYIEKIILEKDDNITICGILEIIYYVK